MCAPHRSDTIMHTHTHTCLVLLSQHSLQHSWLVYMHKVLYIQSHMNTHCVQCASLNKRMLCSAVRVCCVAACQMRDVLAHICMYMNFLLTDRSRTPHTAPTPTAQHTHLSAQKCAQTTAYTLQSSDAHLRPPRLHCSLFQHFSNAMPATNYQQIQQQQQQHHQKEKNIYSTDLYVVPQTQCALTAMQYTEREMKKNEV